jgi:hypothetical protein
VAKTNNSKIGEQQQRIGVLKRQVADIAKGDMRAWESDEARRRYRREVLAVGLRCSDILASNAVTTCR